MAENHEPAADPENPLPDWKNSSPRKVLGARRSAQPAPEGRPDLEQKIASLVDSVKVLQTQISGGDAPAEPEPKARGIKRFQRRGNDEPTDPAPAPAIESVTPGEAVPLNKNVARPRPAPPEEAPSGLAAKGMDYARRHPNILYILAQCVGLGLLLLGYWLGQSGSGEDEEQSGRRTGSAPVRTTGDELLARNGVNDRALDAANVGLRAEAAGDLKAARGAWDGVLANWMQLPGAEYRLAMLDIQNSDYTSADIHLTNSLSAGEMMASCYFVNAWFAGRKSNYPESARQFGSAVRIEPFSAKYLFCWGEASRRAGKSQAGIDAMTKALDRPASPRERRLMMFKLRLAKVEVGHDAPFDAELADHLSKNPVEGDWLLLAAAQDLNRAAFPAAAERLQAARRALPAETYNLYVRDFFFQGYAGNQTVGPLVKIPPTPPADGPLDYGAWPMEEADPAVWPPFAPVL